MHTTTPVEILQKYWGHNSFRPLQEDIIQATLEGRDVLALLPTGGGKSICFQVPGLMKDGVCLVISPLIALMKDQVQRLQEKGITALLLHSGMGYPELKKSLEMASHGAYKFIYVSPERVESSLFLEYLPGLDVQLIAVDEAHCISQWGFDFRPSYRRIADLRLQLSGVPVLALTASATLKVQNDIKEQLHFYTDHRQFQQSFERPNLSYSVFEVPVRQTKMIEILQKVQGSALVYCKSRRHTQMVADLLNMHGLVAGFYHAGLSNEERNRRQEDWINNTIRIMACTNAFGMGIDKPDVRLVIHYDVPDSLENYYQEAGRAGRDGQKSYAVLLYQSTDLDELRSQSELRYPDFETIKRVYIAVMNHLQIAAGSGEGHGADLDLPLLTQQFQLQPFSTIYALKALEQENILRYSDSFFQPSTLVFIAQKQELEDIERHYPQLETVIKGLLRMYEGIIDFPASIYENQLARFIREPVEKLVSDLRQLHALGVVRYSPQKDSPHITLLQNRMYADAFTIDLTQYQLRKVEFDARVEAMLHYIQNNTTCRSQVIARYFNDQQAGICGVCDNCLALKRKPLDAAAFEAFVKKILAVLPQQQRLEASQLKSILPGIGEAHLWEVLHYLQSEAAIKITDEQGLKYVSSF